MCLLLVNFQYLQNPGCVTRLADHTSKKALQVPSPGRQTDSFFKKKCILSLQQIQHPYLSTAPDLHF